MKNTKFYFLLFFSFLFFSITIYGKDIRILAIGNSFSEDAAEQYLYELAEKNGDKLIVGNAYRGGQGFESHWNVVNNGTADFEYRKVVNGVRTNNTGKTLEYCLLDEAWDYITFQQVSQDSGLPNTYEPWLGYLLNYVKGKATNAQVKFAIHRTWAYSKDSNHGGFANYNNNQMIMFQAIVNATNKAMTDHPEITILIPAGTAIQNGRSSFLGDIFNRDGYHLSYGLGRYTAACTWLEVFTGKSPVGNSYRPSTVSEIEALVAQHSAHAAVTTPDAVTSMSNMGYTGDNTIAPAAPVKINFGSLSTSAGWNSVANTNKYVFGLKDTGGTDTQMIVMLDDDFNDANTAGATSTTTSLNMPEDVSKSSLWGYSKGNFENRAIQPTGGFVFSHLNKNLVYDFYIFSSRSGASDNRETQHVLLGENRKRAFVNAASNSTELAFVKAIKPNAKGEIKLTVSAGPNNTNGNSFYYINAMQIVAREYVEGDFDDNEDINKPIEIKTEADFKAMASEQNNGNNYTLMNDITLSGELKAGNLVNIFSGTFNGNGHVIRGLNINDSSTEQIGLFRHLSGTIKNLGLENASINGNANVGGFAGKVQGGTIENCYIANSYIEGRDHVGSLAGQLERGDAGGLIQNCYSTSTVYSREFQGGGLVGTSAGSDPSGKIANCYFSGSLTVKNANRAGGIMALKDNDAGLVIENCVNLAEVVNCGARYRIASINGRQNATFSNNYALAGLTYTDTQSANAAAENGTDVTADKAKTKSFYQNDLGWNFDTVWEMLGDGYPVLKMQKKPVHVQLTGVKDIYALQTGNTIDLNEIKSLRGLSITFNGSNSKLTIENNIATVTGSINGPENADITISVNSADYVIDNGVLRIQLIPTGSIKISSPEDLVFVTANPALTFELSQNIDMTDVTFSGLCSESSPFTGTFDGKGYVIKGLKYENTATSAMGLFRKTKNATVKNLGLTDVRLIGYDNIGAIAGIMEGGKVEQCHVTGYVEARDRAAGIGGYILSGATVENCYVMADIKAREHQLGGVTAATFEGGATIRNCYYSGTLTGGGHGASMVGLIDRDGDVIIENCLNLATSVTGRVPFRICSWNSRESFAKFSNNYSISSTLVGTAVVADGTATNRNGVNLPDDANAKSKDFYTGTLKWDFNNTWTFITDVDYPVLKVFSHSGTGFKPNNATDSYLISKIDNMVYVSNLSEKAAISVFTIQGQQLISDGSVSGEFSFQLPSKGVYIIKITANGNDSVIKLIY